MNRLSTFCAALVCLVGLSACSLFGDVGVEVAPYEVMEADGDFEVRHYESLLLVTTQMPEGMDATSTPFFKLFDYISGNNDKAENISMTAPVFLDQANSSTQAMSFVLPLKFTLANAPPPSDPAVKLQEIRAYTVAVIRFSGFLDQEAIAVQERRLQDWISTNGFEVAGPAKAAGYNPPYTLPFLRRNEIMIPLVNPPTS